MEICEVKTKADLSVWLKETYKELSKAQVESLSHIIYHYCGSRARSRVYDGKMEPDHSYNGLWRERSATIKVLAMKGFIDLRWENAYWKWDEDGSRERIVKYEDVPQNEVASHYKNHSYYWSLNMNYRLNMDKVGDVIRHLIAILCGHYETEKVKDDKLKLFGEKQRCFAHVSKDLIKQILKSNSISANTTDIHVRLPETIKDKQFAVAPTRTMDFPHVLALLSIRGKTPIDIQVQRYLLPFDGFTSISDDGVDEWSEELKKQIKELNSIAARWHYVYDDIVKVLNKAWSLIDADHEQTVPWYVTETSKELSYLEDA
jgi:hypothetical protein